MELLDGEYDINFGLFGVSVDLTFILENTGTGIANNVEIDVLITDQDEEVEYDDTLFITPSMTPGIIETKTINVDVVSDD